ncbi:unnamed protein product, partial [Ectocarpus sp. 12 AP-2014]
VLLRFEKNDTHKTDQHTTARAERNTTYGAAENDVLLTKDGFVLAIFSSPGLILRCTGGTLIPNMPQRHLTLIVTLVWRPVRIRQGMGISENDEYLSRWSGNQS